MKNSSTETVLHGHTGPWWCLPVEHFFDCTIPKDLTRHKISLWVLHECGYELWAFLNGKSHSLWPRQHVQHRTRTKRWYFCRFFEGVSSQAKPLPIQSASAQSTTCLKHQKQSKQTVETIAQQTLTLIKNNIYPLSQSNYLQTNPVICKDLLQGCSILLPAAESWSISLFALLERCCLLGLSGIDCCGWFRLVPKKADFIHSSHYTHCSISVACHRSGDCVRHSCAAQWIPVAGVIQFGDGFDWDFVLIEFRPPRLKKACCILPGRETNWYAQWPMSFFLSSVSLALCVFSTLSRQ